jgi:LysM repeat protein
MKLRRYVWPMAGVVLLMALIPILVSASWLEQEGQNLLQNSGFEGGWHWQGDSFLGKVADGWVAWWVDDAAGKDQSDPTFWKNQRPEYGLIGLEYWIPDQIHGGRQSLQYGKRYATHTAGAYQQVTGIPHGTKIRFSAWGFVYGKDPDPSRSPGYARMKVGIDPTGGTNPFSPNVAWSGIVNPIAVGSGSAWREMSIEAVAAGSAVTVFLYSSPEWPMNDALTSQWDDAQLIVTGQATEPTTTPPAPPPTGQPGPPPPPAATATPRPDGSVVHTVKSGETLWGIAIQYATGSNLDPQNMLAQINRLNNSPALIYSGQELVVAVPQEGLAVAAAAVQGESEPAAPATEGDAQAPAAAVSGEQSAVPAVAPAGAAAASSSTLCVSAYHDRNSDGMRDPSTEELVSNASFTLSSENGVVGSYTSDGASEPYCFAQLVAGTYMVQLTRPDGYNTTTPEYWAVPLPAGTTANVEFGHMADPNAPPPSEKGQAAVPAGEKTGSIENLLQTAKEGAAQSEDESDSKSLLSSLGEIAIGVSGIFVLLLAAAVGVAFVASRRRM